MIDISGLDKVEILRCLHNNTQARGMGVLHDLGRDMTYEEAKAIFDRHSEREGPQGIFFDYVKGRPIKVNFRGNYLDGEHLYDRDAQCRAEYIILEIQTRPEVRKDGNP